MCPEPTLLSSDLANAGLEMDRNNAQRYPNADVIMQTHDDGDGEHRNTVSIEEDMKLMDAPLTNRETEILRYVADGNSNKQIAYILIISEQTVKSHISAILRKLNANDRAHAVSLAMRDGWLSAVKQHGDMIAVS
jgi:DNA-binding NarL/FixJ family response regulator